jgi:outer membrane receptor protein involved in Fe transport
LVPTGNFKNLAGYVLGNVRLLDEKLVFTGALRYDHYKVSDKRIDPEDYTQANPNYYGYTIWPTGQTYEHLSPSFGVSYLPLEWLKLRTNYTHSFRPPSPRELTSGFYEGYNFWGFPWNKAENTDTYEVGFDLNRDFISFSSTYFYSRTKDYIYQHQDLYQDRMRVRNADDQRRSGIEIQASANVAGLLGYESFELLPYFNFSYLFYVKEKYREGETRYGLGDYANAYATQIPKTVIGAGIRFRYPKEQFSANLNFNYWGKVYPSIKTMFLPPAVAYDPSAFYGGFTVVDLSLRKGLIDFEEAGNLELKLNVNNLFDRLYVFGADPSSINRNSTNMNTSYFMPGRNFYLGLVYNF